MLCQAYVIGKALWFVPCSAFVEPLVILAILVANGELANDQLLYWKACIDEIVVYVQR